jgi:hypothetical protein
MNASRLVTAGFVALPLLVAAGFVLASDRADRRLGTPPPVRRRRTIGVAAGTLAWLAVTLLAGASGALRRFDLVPPPFAAMPLGVAVLGIGIAYSPLGSRLVRGLPLWLLVGSQVFRFPLELLMHRAYVEGVMPVQMSYSGWNYDVLTGISGGVLGTWLYAGRVPRRVVGAWNALGCLLLVNIVTIAIASTPIFRAFGPDRLNTFVAGPPFVWLPAILVTAALTGHLLVWRKLAEESAAPPLTGAAPSAAS